MRQVIPIIAVIVLSVACAGDPGPGYDQAAVLAAADGADGSVDRVVHRCAVCSLSMDGEAKHASEHAGYTFHHCSAHCKETFDHDPHAVLKRLQ